MKVSQNNNQAQVQSSETAAPKKSEKAQEAQKAKREKGGAVSGEGRASGASPEISSSAREMAKAHAAAASAPDVREAKVAELKKKIASGEYKVDADAIADKMVREHLGGAALD